MTTAKILGYMPDVDFVFKIDDNGTGPPVHMFQIESTLVLSEDQWETLRADFARDRRDTYIRLIGTFQKRIDVRGKTSHALVQAAFGFLQADDAARDAALAEAVARGIQQET